LRKTTKKLKMEICQRKIPPNNIINTIKNVISEIRFDI